MLTIMCMLGNYWSKHYFNFTENDVWNYGLLGVFFARIFGINWLE